MRELEKPSSEMQTDAIGLQVASAIGGGLGTLALASAGAPPEAYVSFAGAAAVVAGASAYEALRKLRFEKPYGRFFSASVAVASDDVRDGAGTTIVRRGVDEICEVHAINNLTEMARLRRDGLTGRLRIVLESLEGLLALSSDMDDPAYRDVTYVTARSDLTPLLFKIGFDEVGQPPRYDFVNRWDKRALMWAIAKRVGRRPSGDPDSYRMAIMTKARFASDETRAAVERQISRARHDLAHATRIERAETAITADMAEDGAPGT
jgi:hypothetical protein